MNDHDVNWIALVPLAFLVAVLALVLEMAGVWPGKAVRPDLAWCLAFFAARRAFPVVALPTAFVCGLARDLVLGPKLGAATLAYLLVAWTYLYLRETTAGGGFVEHAVLVGGLAFCVNALKTFLDLGGGIAQAWSDYFIVALGDGVATLAAYPVMFLLLSIPFLDPTRERRWSL